MLQVFTADTAAPEWLSYRCGARCVRDGHAGFCEWWNRTDKGVHDEASADAEQEADGEQG